MCIDENGKSKSCEDCKHNPPSKKWPCVDCDMRVHDRLESCEDDLQPTCNKVATDNLEVSSNDEVDDNYKSDEIWKAVPEFEGFYEVSNIGRVRSISRIVRSGRGYRINPSIILKPALGQWGYEQVCLRKNGKKYTKRVNRLVAQTFIPNPDNLPQVNHIDGHKTNNHVDNLEWCDSSQNMIHCHRNGMSDWNTNVRIVETGEEFRSISECAEHIGGHIQLIIACLNGRRKTHKGFHFEIIGKRASEKYNRKPTKGNVNE